MLSPKVNKVFPYKKEKQWIQATVPRGQNVCDDCGLSHSFNITAGPSETVGYDVHLRLQKYSPDDVIRHKAREENQQNDDHERTGLLVIELRPSILPGPLELQQIKGRKNVTDRDDREGQDEA